MKDVLYISAVLYGPHLLALTLYMEELLANEHG